LLIQIQIKIYITNLEYLEYLKLKISKNENLRLIFDFLFLLILVFLLPIFIALFLTNRFFFYLDLDFFFKSFSIHFLSFPANLKVKLSPFFERNYNLMLFF
jgi:hypothetical protein